MLDWIKILWSLKARSRPWALCYVPQTLLNGIRGVQRTLNRFGGGSTVSSVQAIGGWGAEMFQGLPVASSNTRFSNISLE